jgi:hypothetical protein
MCPFCFATVGLVVAGTVSTGGLAALAVKVSRTKNHEADNRANAQERSDENVNPNRR